MHFLLFQTIDCSNAGLRTIPWDLPDPVGLKKLLLNGNQITEIISEIVSYRNLEYLELSDNSLLSIDDDVLDALPNLKYLFIHNNRLSRISQRTFKVSVACSIPREGAHPRKERVGLFRAKKLRKKRGLFYISSAQNWGPFLYFLDQNRRKTLFQ